MKKTNRDKLVKAHNMLDDILLWDNGLPDEGTPPVNELAYAAMNLINDVIHDEMPKHSKRGKP